MMIGDDEGADQWQNSYQNHNSGKFSPNNFNNYDSSPVQNNLTPVFNRYVKPGKSILKKPNDEIVFNLSLHPTSPKPPLPPPDNSAASSSGKAGQLGDTITSSSGNTSESSPVPQPKIIPKYVSFTLDTVFPGDHNIALSITKHLYTKEVGYTQYHIQMLHKGVSWTVLKRYRDFTDFHRKLVLENTFYNFPLPELPKKRWFEKQRWLNRFDDSYSLHRRIALQEYLRIVAKIPYVRHRFRSFDEFVECPVEKDEITEEMVSQPAEGDRSQTNTATSEEEDDEEEEDEGEEDHGMTHPGSSESSQTKKLHSRFRDSILETKLNQEFDDDGEVLASSTSRP